MTLSIEASEPVGIFQWLTAEHNNKGFDGYLSGYPSGRCGGMEYFRKNECRVMEVVRPYDQG